jgi:hypothetical protein
VGLDRERKLLLARRQCPALIGFGPASQGAFQPLAKSLVHLDQLFFGPAILPVTGLKIADETFVPQSTIVVAERRPAHARKTLQKSKLSATKV